MSLGEQGVSRRGIDHVLNFGFGEMGEEAQALARWR